MPVVPAGVRDAVYIGSKALFKRPVRLILALGHVHAVDVESKRKRLARLARIKLGHHAECEVPFDEGLLERLKAWRLGVAKRQSVPAFVVFTDATLMALAQAEPSDERGLLEIRGIGRSKARRYGQDVLAIIGGLDVDEVLAGARAPGDDQPSGG